jgi:hypothetical protein
LLTVCLLPALLAGAAARAADTPLNRQRVMLEIRFVSLSNDCFKQLPGNMGLREEMEKAEAADECRFIKDLSDLETYLFMEVVQGDRDSNVMMTPRLVTRHDETAVVETREKRSFTTGADLSWDGKQLVTRTRKEEIPLGVRLSVLPVLSQDRKTVYVNFEGAVSSLQCDPPAKVTMRLSADKTIDLDKPAVNRLSADTTFSVPEGRTALLGGWKRVRHVLVPCKSFDSSSCKDVAMGKTEHVLVLVTPRLVKESEEASEEQEPKPAAAAKHDDDPPDDAAVLRALPKLPDETPLLRVFRDDVSIVTHLQAQEPKKTWYGEPYVERTWKCTVFYNEVIESSYPFPFRCKRPRVECLSLTTGDRFAVPKVLCMPSPCY